LNAIDSTLNQRLTIAGQQPLVIPDQHSISDTASSNSRHAHGLLASGRNTLERFFPSLFEEIMSIGAVKCYMTRDANWCFNGGEHVRFDSDLEGVLVSRPVIEGNVRE
jgi:hypothetical protein